MMRLPLAPIIERGGPLSPEPPTLSASSIDMFLRCPKMYLYANVFRVPGAQSLAAAIGVSVHAAAEAFWKKPLRPLQAAERAWKAELASVPTADIEADPGAPDDIRKMVEVYVRDVAPTFTPTLVEAPFLIEVDGLRLSGTLDAADEDVHDLKTYAGKTINGKKPSNFDPYKHSLQLSLYRLGYRALTGHWPRRLLIDALSRAGRYKQYEIPPDVGGMLDAAHLTADGIMRGEFAPTGSLNGACHFCSFREICPDANLG